MQEPMYDYRGTGAICFELGSNYTFYSPGSENVMLSKWLISRIFQEMYKLHYDVVISSDISRLKGKGHLFFKKSNVSLERKYSSVFCVAPDNCDTMTLVKCPDDAKEAIKRAILQVWRPGIKEEKYEQICGNIERIFATTLKLKEAPFEMDWSKSEDRDKSMDCRKMLISIIENLEKIEGAQNCCYVALYEQSAMQFHCNKF